LRAIALVILRPADQPGVRLDLQEREDAPAGVRMQVDDASNLHGTASNGRAGARCAYSATIAAAATITLPSRNRPISASSILSQWARTLPLCCPSGGAGPTAGNR